MPIIFRLTNMKTRTLCCFSLVIFIIIGCGNPETQLEETPVHNVEASEMVNELTAEEKKENWKLLFDGESTAGWRGINQDTFPGEGWKIEGGMLMVNAADGRESSNGGDIITIEQYSDFVFDIDWKMMTQGGNSGVKYFVKEGLSGNEKYGVGPEYQILDDEYHPWMLDGRMQPDDFFTLASLYEIYPAENKSPKPLGEWNHSRIVVQGKEVEHWLNGVSVLKYNRGSEDFREKVAESKFNQFENYGEAKEGHILLQDHGDKVAFRNIKIKELY